MFHKEIQLKDYQKVDVEFVIKNHYVLIADEMGLGKTFAALGVVKKLSLYPCLVIVPKSLKTNWYREIKRMDHYKTTDIVQGNDHVIEKDGVYFAKSYTIVNYDSHKLIAKMPKCRSIIMDEIHYLKNYQAKRTIVIKNYVRTSGASHVMGLSGTPILNKGTEIVSVVNSIHYNLINLEEFLNNYCLEGKWGGWFVSPTKVTNINSMLKRRGIMIRHTKDVLNLPLKLRKKIAFEKPHGYENYVVSQHRKYGDITMAALQKVRLFLELGKISHIVSYTEDLVDETNQKVIVFTNYKKPTEIIAEKLNTKFIHGDIVDDERAKIFSEFENDPNRKILVITIQTGNVGLNLTHAKHVVFAGYSYSPASMMQAEDRIHRIGQDQNVTIHYTYASETVDEDAVDLLREKIKYLNGIIDGKKFEFESRQTIDQSMRLKLKKLFVQFGQKRK